MAKNGNFLRRRTFAALSWCSVFSAMPVKGSDEDGRSPCAEVAAAASCVGTGGAAAFSIKLTSKMDSRRAGGGEGGGESRPCDRVVCRVVFSGCCGRRAAGSVEACRRVHAAVWGKRAVGEDPNLPLSIAAGKGSGSTTREACALALSDGCRAWALALTAGGRRRAGSDSDPPKPWFELVLGLRFELVLGLWLALVLGLGLGFG
jgi:hypothetical protein